MCPVSTENYGGEANHVYYQDDRFYSAAPLASAAGERRQNLDHRTVVEHYRLLGRPADRIRVYQERRPRDDLRQPGVRLPAGDRRVERITKGYRVYRLLRQARGLLRSGPVPDGDLGHV